MQHSRIRANGIDFAYASEGTGPLVILLHGFPDTPQTWDHVRPALAAAGYRAVTPFLRGYHPTGLAPDGRYDTDTLGKDALALIDALGEHTAILVGHDWGASAAYSAAALGPEKLRLLVTVAIPHPAALKPSLGLLWRGRHIAALKLPGAAAALRKSDFAKIDELVRRWSPEWNVPERETAAIKACLREPGATEAAVEYYRQLAVTLPPSFRTKIKVPAVAFAGESDGVVLDLGVYDQSRSRFDSSYEVIRMPGGHFLHREHPREFTDALLGVMARLAPR